MIPFDGDHTGELGPQGQKNGIKALVFYLIQILDLSAGMNRHTHLGDPINLLSQNPRWEPVGGDSVTQHPAWFPLGLKEYRLVPHPV
jgi:hypothetical protein